MAKLLADNGVSFADLQTAMAVPAPAKTVTRTTQRPRGFRSSVATATRPVYVKKYTYGTAPVGVTARATHQARLAALEAQLPGFGKSAYVFSVGKNGQGQLEKHLDSVVNHPWTWIELPGGKDFVHGNMTSDQVRGILASLGYGFSPSNGLWATDGAGHPTRRIRQYQAQQAGKNMINNDE